VGWSVLTQRFGECVGGTAQGARLFVCNYVSVRSHYLANLMIIYRYEPHNDVSVNDGPHIRRWSHKIILL
jgi:hypothetical protein